MFLHITGTKDNQDGGNGPYVAALTEVDKSLIILTAGEESYIRITIKNSENKRYNGLFTKADLKYVETVDSAMAEAKLVFSLSESDKNGVYILGLKCNTALTEDDMKKYV